MMMSKPIRVPGIFRVDGVTLILCKKIASKNLELWLPKGGNLTPDVYQSKFTQEVDRIFIGGKPRAISKEFSDPKFAMEYLQNIGT
jgi:hypothetical protein